MDKAPKEGSRIKVVKGHRYFPCEGIVECIYQEWYYNVEDDDPRWDDPDFIPRRTTLRPESEWKVTMVINSKPKDWAYGDQKKFCPDVSEIELIGGG